MKREQAQRGLLELDDGRLGLTQAHKVYYKRLVLAVALFCAALCFMATRGRNLTRTSDTDLDMAGRLKHLRVNPVGEHVGTVIFLHGLGDTGRGWLQAAQLLAMPGIRFVLPHAPEIPITLNHGYRMPGWFDINKLDRLQESKHDDEQGMMASVASVEALIQAEIDAGIPSNKIVLGGFSQGGAIATLLGLTTTHQLAGIAALSTWVPLNHKISDLVTENAKTTPFFWGHGTDDQVVGYQYGQRSVELLKGLGFPAVPTGSAFARPGLRFESYRGMGHSSCPEELSDLKSWLQEALKDQA